MPMTMDIMLDVGDGNSCKLQKLAIHLTDFLYSHPLVTCSLMIGVGIVIGLMLMMIIFELITPAVPYTEMDEEPEINKEKNE